MRTGSWCGWFLLAVGLLSGCIKAPPFICTNDAQCNSKPPGICVQFEGRQGYCAVPVGDCPSGYRYHESAALELVGTCALIPKFEIQSPVTQIDEHVQFPIHVIVRDNNNQKYTSYAGKPTISSNWGDVKVFSGGDFVGGETDITVWLNRETNTTDGPASIVLQDGSAVGRSVGIMVTAPAWQLGATSTPAPADMTINVTGVYALVLRPGQFTYDFFYSLYKSSSGPPLEDIYHATSATVSSWSTSATPALSRGQVPFQTNPSSLQVHAALFSGGIYRLLFLTDQGSGIADSADGNSWKFRRATALAVDSTTDPQACTQVLGPIGLIEEGVGHLRMYYISKRGSSETTCTAETMDGGVSFVNGTPLSFAANNGSVFYQVVKEGTVYKAWGLHDYATSSDGVNWVRSPTRSDFDVRTAVWNEAEKQYVGLHRVDLRQMQRINRK